MISWTQSAAICIGMALVGCGSIGNAVRTIKGENQTKYDPGFSQADAQGTWQVVCEPRSAAEGTFMASITLVLAQDKMTRDAIYFSDPECKTPVLTTHQTGYLTVGYATSNDYRVAVVQNLSTVDTPHTSDVVASLDKNSACSAKTWAVGVAQDVSSSSACNALSTNDGLAVNAVQVILDDGQPKLSLLHQDGNHISMSSGDQYTKKP